MNEFEYKKIVKRNLPKKKPLKNIIYAFFGGGVVALIVEIIYVIGRKYLFLDDNTASLYSSLSMIIFSVISTFFGFYNNIAQKLGAGLFLPTTGFANSLTSSSMEGRSEGLIQGIGGNIFSLAGSVIAFGMFAAFYFATLYYILNVLGINIWA